MILVIRIELLLSAVILYGVKVLNDDDDDDNGDHGVDCNDSVIFINAWPKEYNNNIIRFSLS